MKLKNLFQLVILISVITFYSCGPETKEEQLENLIEDADEARNKSVYTDPIEFNDAIVGLDTKIVMEVLKFMAMEDVEEMRKQLSVMQQEVLSATEILQNISCPKDKNNKFKNATISKFNVYNKIYGESWSLFLDEMDNENIDNMLDYNENISETLNDKLYNIIELEEIDLEQEHTLWISAQESFAKEAGFMMSTEGHPLDEEIDNL